MAQAEDVNDLTNDSLFVAMAVTWVCSCLMFFLMSLNWPHQCEYRGCIHKPRGRSPK